MNCFKEFKKFLINIKKELIHRIDGLNKKALFEASSLDNWENVYFLKQPKTLKDKLLKSISPKRYADKWKDDKENEIIEINQTIRKYKSLINIINDIFDSFSDTQAIDIIENPIWFFYFAKKAVITEYISVNGMSHILGSAWAYEGSFLDNPETELDVIIKELSKYYDINGNFQLNGDSKSLKQLYLKLALSDEAFMKNEDHYKNYVKSLDMINEMQELYEDFCEKETKPKIDNIFFLKDENGISYVDQDLEAVGSQLIKSELLNSENLRKLPWDEFQNLNFFELLISGSRLILFELEPNVYLALGAISSCIGYSDVMLRLYNINNQNQIIELRVNFRNTEIAENILAENKKELNDDLTLKRD